MPSSSGCAPRSATGCASSAAWTPPPACRRCPARTSGSSPGRSSPRPSRSTPAPRSTVGPDPAQRPGGGGARRRRPRRALRRRPAAAAARRPGGREHRHQRLRPGLRRLRRRPGGAGRAGRRDRRGADRADPGARRLLRPVQPAVRHRQPAARPAAAGRLPAVGGHGRDAGGRRCRSGGPGWARSSWPTWSATARCARGSPRSSPRPSAARKNIMIAGATNAGQDHAAAGAGQRDPAARAADHRRARAGARPRPVPRPAPERGGVRGAAAQLRGPGRDHAWPSWSAARCG